MVYVERGNQNPCIICGRECNPKTTKSIHMKVDGTFTNREYQDDDSQGCFFIGKDCLKKQSMQIQKLAFKQ